MSDGFRLPRRRDFNGVKAQLTRTMPGEGVVIHYNDRQPTAGRGMVSGVRTLRYVEVLKLASEWAWRRLTNPPIALPKPPRPINIYVTELEEWRGSVDPITFDETRDDLPAVAKYPAVAVPCRTAATTIDLELEYVTSIAVHEMAHAVCTQCRGMTSVQKVLASRWVWVAEATSVWLEGQLQQEAKDAGLPMTRESLIYAPDWCDYPERPLDSEFALYQSAQFMRFLASEYGEAIIGRLWRRGKVRKDPWTVIEGLTKRTRDELFLDYAACSYLLNDDTRHCHCSEIYRRFGGRLATESWTLAPGESLTASGSVWPMGSRYYRVFTEGGRAVELQWNGHGRVSMALGAATADLTGIGVVETLDGAGRARIELDGTQHHAWVVACGIAGMGETSFEFSVRAL